MKNRLQGVILNPYASYEKNMLTTAETTVIGIILILLGLIFFTRLKTELIAVIVLLMVAISGLVPAPTGS